MSKPVYKTLPIYYFLVVCQVLLIALCVTMIFVPLVAYFAYVVPNTQNGLGITTIDNDEMCSQIVEAPTAIIYDKNANLDTICADDLMIYTSNENGRTIYYVVKLVDVNAESDTIKVFDGENSLDVSIEQFFAKVTSTHYNVGQIIELFYGNFFSVLLIIFIFLLCIVIKLTQTVKKANSEPATKKLEDKKM